MKKFALFLLLLCVPLLIGACQSKEAKPPVIGAILATSGKADFIGNPEKEVLEALLEDYNRAGQNQFGIKIEILDSGGDPARATTLFNRLVKDDNVIAVIGPSTSGESIAVAKEAEQMQMPLLSLAASRQIVQDDSGATRRWVFKFAQNDDLAAKRLLNAMADQKDARIAMLYSDDGFGKSGFEVFSESTKGTSVSLAHQAAFPPALDSPEAFIAAIPEVDAILIWGTAPGPALLIKAAREHFKGNIYLSHGNASEDFIASAGPAAEDAIIVGSRVLMDPKFLDTGNPADRVIIKYRDFWHKRFATAPSHFAGHARDALEAVMAVLSTTTLGENVATRRTHLRDGLEALKQYHGVTGTFTFSPTDHAGLKIQAFQTYRIDAGHFIPYKGSNE